MPDDAYETARAKILAAGPRVRTLDLSNNQLTALPPEISRLTALRNLYLGNNQLTALPPEITSLTALRYLYLDGNQLTTLLPEISRLTALQHLDLNDNQLTTLPPEISRLTALQHLDLRDNQLTALPPEISSLTALQSLFLGDNQLTALPPEITRLTALRLLGLRHNQLRTLPPGLGALTSLERAAANDSLGITDGLFIENNPLPDPYPSLIAPGQPDATLNVLAYLRGERPDLPPPVPASSLEPPPELPLQGIGPHYELNPSGIIVPAPPEALDNAGNHLPRLRSLHPDLRELARDLAASLGAGNAPHAALAERVVAYAALIDQDLADIDFARLYAAGIRLANAARAADQAIEKKDLPDHDPTDREKLDSLLDLHGPFILATAAGGEAMADEARYKRRPAEERQLRVDTVAVLQTMQDRPDLIDPATARDALETAQEIGTGGNPERSTVAGRAKIRNLLLPMAGGALGAAAYANAGYILWAVGGGVAWFTHLTLSETVKKTRWFKSFTDRAASGIDAMMDPAEKQAADQLRAGLEKQRNFVQENEPALRRLAGNRPEFNFLHRALDWLQQRR